MPSNEIVDISDEVSQKMAKESFKEGDKVVPRDPKLRLYGIWTVTGVTRYLITARCRVNGETQEEFFGRLDIICKIPKDGQIMFSFFYD